MAMRQPVADDVFALEAKLRMLMTFTHQKIEGLFAELLEKKDENASVVFYAGQGTVLADFMQVARIDLRVAKPGNERLKGGFLHLALEGACVKEEQIEARYGKLEPQFPGPSAPREIGYLRVADGIKTTFISSMKTGCLTALVMEYAD